MCRSQTLIFDLSETSILENNRIWVLWAQKKKALHWCSWKYLFTYGRQIRKFSLPKIFSEKVLLSNCNLWTLGNRHFRKQKNLRYLGPKKSTSLELLKIPFYVRHIPKTYISEKILEKLLFWNYDLWALWNWHSWKQQNLSYLSPKEKSTSLVLLKIPFYVRETNTWNFHWKKTF